MTNGSCHNTTESNVHPYVKPCRSAETIRSTTAEAGGSVCSTTPKSMRNPNQTKYCDSSRDRNFPWPSDPWNSPPSMTTDPRDSTVDTPPVIDMPSYAE